jgi:uncharacterized membrane protein
MENLVVITFQNVQDAISGLNRLRELDQIGDIVLYNVVLMQKKDKGYELLYHDGPDTREMPAKGAVAGSLVGALAGPIGMALGMMTGTIAGSLDKEDTDAFKKDFLDKVNQHLLPEGLAVVLYLEEDDEVMINSYMEAYHGQIVRTNIVDQYARYSQRQWNELNSEIEEEEKELKAAREEKKAAIKAKLNTLKTEREEKMKKFKARMSASKEQLQNKVKDLEQKVVTAQGRMKDKMKAHKQLLQQKLNKWNEEVEQAMA